MIVKNYRAGNMGQENMVSRKHHVRRVAIASQRSDDSGQGRVEIKGL